MRGETAYEGRSGTGENTWRSGLRESVQDNAHEGLTRSLGRGLRGGLSSCLQSGLPSRVGDGLPGRLQSGLPSRLRKTAKLAADAVAEALWPSRCAVCDSPGPVLCRRCKRRLPYIDLLKACPRCGAPWGALECSECNSFVMKRRMGGAFGLDGCVSLLASTPEALALTAMLKDRNELRLADELGALLAEALPRRLLTDAAAANDVAANDVAANHGAAVPVEAVPVEAVTWVPARPDAVRRRGFDHAQLLAQACARTLELPASGLLGARKARDQRKLAAVQRARNMHDAFFVKEEVLAKPLPQGVLLVDDVYTTGATLMGAAGVLRQAGVRRVVGATVLRVL